MTLNSKTAFRAIRSFLKLHPVRQERSNKRNLEFSGWLRHNCRPSQKGCKVDLIELGGFVCFDLDFILYDYGRKILLLLEVKTHNSKVRFSQRETLEMLDSICSSGSAQASVLYLGLHVLTMDGTTPFNSDNITWDGNSISREQCYRNINMLDAIQLLGGAQ